MFPWKETLQVRTQVKKKQNPPATLHSFLGNIRRNVLSYSSYFRGFCFSCCDWWHIIIFAHVEGAFNEIFLHLCSIFSLSSAPSTTTPSDFLPSGKDSDLSPVFEFYSSSKIPNQIYLLHKSPWKVIHPCSDVSGIFTTVYYINIWICLNLPRRLRFLNSKSRYI